MKRFALVGVVSALGMLAFCGTAGAAGDTYATCTLNAHIGFSSPIKLTPSSGSVSGDSASWSCTGLIGGGTSFSNEKNPKVFGTYGNPASSADSCTAGLEKLTVAEGPFPGGLGLNLTVNRSALVLSASGSGTAGNYGLTLSGTGTFTPDSPTACLTSGWASGSIQLTLLVKGGPVPSNPVGGAYTATRPDTTRHKNPNTRGRVHARARRHRAGSVRSSDSRR